MNRVERKSVLITKGEVEEGILVGRIIENVVCAIPELRLLSCSG
jgi:transcription initiation factor TFIIIB Brf1 subunit/transcription initiation factor TFIIB